MPNFEQDGHDCGEHMAYGGPCAVCGRRANTEAPTRAFDPPYKRRSDADDTFRLISEVTVRAAAVVAVVHFFDLARMQKIEDDAVEMIAGIAKMHEDTTRRDVKMLRRGFGIAEGVVVDDSGTWDEAKRILELRCQGIAPEAPCGAVFRTPDLRAQEVELEAEPFTWHDLGTLVAHIEGAEAFVVEKMKNEERLRDDMYAANFTDARLAEIKKYPLYYQEGSESTVVALVDEVLRLQALIEGTTKS